MGTKWNLELDAIKQVLKEDKTLDQIGEKYAVSRQRIYQVLTKYGIPTPLRERKNYLRDKPASVYWLNHLLTNKKVSEEIRMKILDSISLPSHCPILGIELNYNGLGEQAFIRSDSSPSLDQIIPSKGYTADNVQVISWRANRIKNDATPEELMKIAQYMKQLTKKDSKV